MARVNYQREKRLRDLDRQRRQEEKRQKKLQRGQGTDAGEDPGQAVAVEVGETPDGAQGAELPEGKPEDGTPEV